MLDAVPDVRPALNASDEELAEIFRAFDLTITYDKHEQPLHLGATITPDSARPPPQRKRPPRGTVAD